MNYNQETSCTSASFVSTDDISYTNLLEKYAIQINNTEETGIADYPSITRTLKINELFMLMDVVKNNRIVTTSDQVRKIFNIINKY